MLFIVAENWNHPKSPTIGKQLGKLWDADKKESCSIIGNDKHMP